MVFIGYFAAERFFWRLNGNQPNPPDAIRVDEPPPRRHF
jgi:hypothetical protein